jgi:hypothetical protein
MQPTRCRPAPSRTQFTATGEAAWNCGSAWGQAFGELAGELFGGLGAVLGAAAGGYFGGNAVAHQMEAEGQRLPQAFNVMLQAYDQAMYNLSNAALDMVFGQCGAGVVTGHR